MKRFVIFYHGQELVPGETNPDGTQKYRKVAKGIWIGPGKKSVVSLHRQVYREQMLGFLRHVRRNPELLEGAAA